MFIDVQVHINEAGLAVLAGYVQRYIEFCGPQREDVGQLEVCRAWHCVLLC